MRSSVVAIAAGGRPCLALSIPSDEFRTTESMGDGRLWRPDPTTTCDRPPSSSSPPPADVDDDGVPDRPSRRRDGATPYRTTSKRWRDSFGSWASG
jgi:hypothetical protein